MSLLLTNAKKTDQSITNIFISDGIIKNINSDIIKADHIVNLKGKYVLPGMIDPHVHMRDMDQSYKEDWISGSKSALRGGITTVIDMPNTVPQTINNKN